MSALMQLMTLSISVITLVTSAFASASPVIYSCVQENSHGQTTLLLSATDQSAKLTQNWDTRFTKPLAELVQDRNYTMGNGGKKYQRYLSTEMNLLVPKLMVEAKINQGTIVMYTSHGKTRYTCERLSADL